MWITVFLTLAFANDRCTTAPAADEPEQALVAVPMCGVTGAKRIEAQFERTLVQDGAGVVRAYGGGGRFDHGFVVEEAIADVATTETTCALLAGTVECHGWIGETEAGLVRGDGPIVGVTNAVQFDLEDLGGCAVRSDGALLCWGRPTGGVGEASAVAGVTDAAEVHLSNNGSGCVRSKAGALSCWDGDQPASSLTPIAGATNLISFDRSVLHICGVRTDGTVVCAGRNDSGQLGDGTRADHIDARPVRGIQDAVQVSTGGHHSCVLAGSGAVFCFGANAFGELGLPRSATDAL